MKAKSIVAFFAVCVLGYISYFSYRIGYINGKHDEWNRNFKKEQIQRLEAQDKLTDAEAIRYKELREEVGE